MRCLILFGALLAGATTVHALDPTKALTQYAVDVWTVEDGLPQNFVTSLAQTKDGYLWIGTQNGLARFDGKQFTIFHGGNTEAFTSEYVSTLMADRAGVLWIATGNELVRHAAGRFEVVTLEDGASIGDTRCLFQDGEDRFLIGRTQLPTLVYDNGRVEEFEDPQGTRIRNVTGIVKLDSGVLCFATDHGFCLMDGQFENMGLTRKPTAFRVHEGFLWAATTEGLLVIDPDRLETTVERDVVDGNPVVFGLHADEAGAMWVGTNVGLARIHRGEVVRSPVGWLPAAPVQCLVQDHEGSLWVGTAGGLARLRETRFDVFSVPEGLSAPRAYAVFEDRHGAIWVSTENRGLQRWVDGGWTRFGPDAGVEHDVLAIWDESDGTVWIGLAVGGARRLTDGRFVPRGGPDMVFVGRREPDGSMLVAGPDGLFRSAPGGFARVPWAPDLRGVSSLHRSADGALWLGSHTANLIRRSGADNIDFGADDRLRGAPVLGFHEDATGAVWAATYGAGLLRIQGESLFQFTMDHGLPTNNWYAVTEDSGGTLWLSSDRGIASVSRERLQRVAAGDELEPDIRLFGKADGMRSAECNGGYNPSIVRARDGRIWFPTADGVVVVDPSRLDVKPFDLPVRVERLVAGGHEATPDDAGRTRIAAGDRNIELHYIGISFLAPDAIRFRYRLVGYDDTWTEAGTRRTAYYTHISPGRYTFEVQARNTDGIWGEQVATTRFVVESFFYETVWFYLLIATAMGSALYAIHVYRLRRLLEIERVRTRIATDLHDDLGSSLSRISILSEVAKRQIERGGEKPRDLVSEIGETARRLIDATSDIVWSIDPRRDDLGSVVARVRAFGNDLFEETGTVCAVEVAGVLEQTRLSVESRRHLYLILKEALANAAKHSQATQVRVSIVEDNGAIAGRIEDDGQGFDVEALERADRLGGNGLGNMKARAASVGGTAVVESASGKGTTVIVRIPASR